jgi:putative PEP-CTERM system histidine kinase
MLRDPGIISYGSAAALYAVLAVLVASRYLRRNTDRALFLAAIISSLWGATVVAQSLSGHPGFLVRYLVELLRDSVWILLLFAILRNAVSQGRLADQLKKGLGIVATGLVVSLATLGAVELLFSVELLTGKTRVIGQLALSLLGLSLVEQIWRNSPAFSRSSLKYLCIGVATLFGYDFLMYSDALLFGQITGPFWDARGFINAALVPLFAINVINTRKQPVDFHLSRSAVFHVGTLIFAGGYLLFLAAGGYYVRALGGQWGEALQVMFITVAIAFLVTLMVSRRIRARLMVFISQNFFDYKYDYREEWLKMTRELASVDNDPPLPERVIRILASLVESNAGAIWVQDDHKNYTLKASLNMAPPKHTIIDADSEMACYFCNHEWVIDLNEYRNDPLSYDLLEIPEPIICIPDAWLIIPLYLGTTLYGIAIVNRPWAKVELNWENFDLIKVVARQSSNLLAQADAQNRLSRAMQFEAVNKASAFMIHDLKTLIAQLSLLVSNAPRHRDNPAFIDDMIATTDHAVQKMSNLVNHIHKPGDNDTEQAAPINLITLLEELIESTSNHTPVPVLETSSDTIAVYADKEQLRNVLGHLICNAQHATPPDGEITLSVKASSESVVLFIQDSGGGMSEEFIRTRLFKPFESTKGLAGMGIGAYQAKEYIHELGGGIDVTSELDVGSCFSIRLPLAISEGDVEDSDAPVFDTKEDGNSSSIRH